MTNQVPCVYIVSLLAITVLTGCSKTSEPATQTEVPSENTTAAHNPDDISLTDSEIEALKQGVTSYTDALSKIKSYRNTIRDEIAAGDPHKAHRPLEELNAVLEHLPIVARDNNIPKSQWETVNTSAQQLRDLFNKVHAQIDGGEEVDYTAIAGDIDLVLAKLAGVEPSS